jgi:hypothetical protein
MRLTTNLPTNSRSPSRSATVGLCPDIEKKTLCALPIVVATLVATSLNPSQPIETAPTSDPTPPETSIQTP